MKNTMTVTTMKRVICLASGLLSAILSLAPAARAESTATPIASLPAIACVEPIRKVKEDYEQYRKGRISIAKHFMRHQIRALEKLQENTKNQMPTIRDFMTMKRLSNAKDDQAADLHAVDVLLGGTLDRAQSDYDDDAPSYNPGWKVRMNTHVTLKNGDYGVSACSRVTWSYDRRIYGRLWTCSLLDLETGTIWGRTPEEALELGGNKMDEARFTYHELATDFPMCIRQAGFADVSAPVISELFEKPTPDSSPKLISQEAYLAPLWGPKTNDEPYSQNPAQ